MRVGLIHVGGTLPNLALMRLSTHHKRLGDTVVLEPTPLDRPDVVYISTLFTWRRKQVEELAAHYRPFADVYVGGSGFNLGLRLPPEVDACPNDYDLEWPVNERAARTRRAIEYGMGYSSRGCIRHCRFCPVPRAEGGIHEDQPISSLLNPRSNRLMLLDNNFFASDWRPKVQEIKGRNLWVDWPQGNDIRLMTDEIAQSLADLHHHGQLWGDRFTARGWLHFAWDLPWNEARADEVVRGVKLLYDVGFTKEHLRFYVLIGFPGYQVEEELGRITTLHSLGIEPFVMVYRDYGDTDTRDPVRMDVQHWNNGHGWKKIPFSEYRRALTGGKARQSGTLSLL